MPRNSIAEDIIKTGGVIRDWVAPFYTLGAAVAFAIGMLTLLDEDGTLRLTRIVGAALLIATFLAWAQHLYKQHKNKEHAVSPEPAKAKFHIVLLIITSFFMVGILVSEAVMKGHRKQLQIQNASSETPAPITTPQKASTTIPVAIDVEPDKKPVVLDASKPSQPVVTTSSSSTSTSKDKQEPVTPKPPKPPKPRPPEEPKTEQTINTKDKKPAVQDERCSAVIAAFSLGQDLSPQQQKDLEKCR